jgi:hypothetical protein
MTTIIYQPKSHSLFPGSPTQIWASDKHFPPPKPCELEHSALAVFIFTRDDKSTLLLFAFALEAKKTIVAMAATPAAPKIFFFI